MADFQSAFDTNTQSINTVVSTQISSAQSWANIPGSLVKSSASAAGYVWGFNTQNMVYVCQVPCSGSNWKNVDLTKSLPTQPSDPTRRCYAEPVSTSLKNFFYPTPFEQWRTEVNQGRSNPNFVSKTLEGAQDLCAKNTACRGVFSWQGNGETYYAVWDQDDTLGNATFESTAYTGVYRKLVPCPPAPVSGVAILDIVTDEANVYVLITTGSNGKTYILMKPASNAGDWNVVQVPQQPPTKIFSTHTYLWAQDDKKNKFKSPKPIGMSGWMPVTDTSVSITSSSSTALYGVDDKGQAMKSDETLQTGWTPVTGFAGTPVTSLMGNIDQAALYGIGQNSKVKRCEGDCTNSSQVTPLDTGGYVPMSLSADPNTKQLWMTTSTWGNAGNIFNRTESPDYSSILNTITPADQKRDQSVQDINKGFQQQTDVMSVNKQLTDFEGMFKKLFGSTDTALAANKKQIADLQATVTDTKGRLDQVKTMEPIIIKFMLTLAAAALVYATFSFLGWIVHILVLVVLGVGIYLSLNNDIALPPMWG